MFFVWFKLTDVRKRTLLYFILFQHSYTNCFQIRCLQSTQSYLINRKYFIAIIVPSFFACLVLQTCLWYLHRYKYCWTLNFHILVCSFSSHSNLFTVNVNDDIIRNSLQWLTLTSSEYNLLMMHDGKFNFHLNINCPIQKKYLVTFSKVWSIFLNIFSPIVYTVEAA